MSERFFVGEPISQDTATLDGPEAHHLLHVMRAKVGDRVVVFDGSGAEFSAEVARLARSEVQLRILERRAVSRELPRRITCGVALPKGDRQKWLVEKLTEIGVSTLVPLCTERGVAQPTDAALERLRRAVIEAAKQCGRNRLMEITAPAPWHEWMASVPSSERRLVAHPSGAELATLDLGSGLPASIAVGPEGGFTDMEVTRAVECGWQSVSLGARILRVETAAIVLTSVVAVGGGFRVQG